MAASKTETTATKNAFIGLCHEMIKQWSREIPWFIHPNLRDPIITFNIALDPGINLAQTIMLIEIVEASIFPLQDFK